MPTAPSGGPGTGEPPVLSGEKGKKWVEGAKDAEAVGQSEPGGLAAGGGAPPGLGGLGMTGEDDKRGHDAGSEESTAVH